jgi:hypothetical protein
MNEGRSNISPFLRQMRPNETSNNLIKRTTFDPCWLWSSLLPTTTSRPLILGGTLYHHPHVSPQIVVRLIVQHFWRERARCLLVEAAQYRQSTQHSLGVLARNVAIHTITTLTCCPYDRHQVRIMIVELSREFVAALLQSEEDQKMM